MQNETKWDREVDLLVIGAGAGGMAAGLIGAIEGLSVLIIEKSEFVGGTAATSAGTIWIPGNRQSVEAGYSDTVEAARIYMQKLTGSGDNSGLREAYFASGPEAIEYLRANSQVHFVPSGKHPDYRDMEGAAVFGRALAPKMFDGRLLGKNFERVRPPIPEFMVLGGMMVGKDDIAKLIGRFRSLGNFVHGAKLALRYYSDRLRYSRGTRVVMGNALVSRLYCSLLERKVPVLFGATITELLKDHDRIAGAIISANGRMQRIGVRKGVVIATGGYGHNDDMRKQFMPAPTPPYSVACESNAGEGIALGLANGGTVAPHKQGPGAFWTPVSVTKRANGRAGVFPHLSLDRAKPGLIAVNGAGKRFVNEGASYHDFVEAMFESHRHTPTMPAHLICDADFVRDYGLGNVHPGTTNLSQWERDGYLVVAPSLAALAQRLNIDAQGLEATVARYNEMARAGKDLDFGKGDTELNRFNGDPAQKPNPCLRPIARGPFISVAVWPAEIATSTGLETNRDGQVLDAQGQPIKGLYACGNDMASVMMGTYPGPGTTLGPALTFAYRLAHHAAGKALP